MEFLNVRLYNQRTKETLFDTIKPRLMKYNIRTEE